MFERKLPAFYRSLPRLCIVEQELARRAAEVIEIMTNFIKMEYSRPIAGWR